MNIKGALVVDDCPNTRALLREVLEQEGLSHIFEAEDGVEALQVLSKHGAQIEGMFLDLTMPRMSGDMVLAKLRTVHDGPLGVVLMSAHKAIETTVAENRDSDLHLVYIYKPFNIQSFLLLTESVMQRTRAALASLA